MEFDQILHMHFYWQDLGWLLAVIFHKFATELWPLIGIYSMKSATAGLHSDSLALLVVYVWLCHESLKKYP